MKSDSPKVLHEVCGRPMLAYALDACRLGGIDRIVVVVGHQKELVVEAFDGHSDLTFVTQEEQKGTGHAVMFAEPVLKDFAGPVLVIAGDMPLIRSEIVSELLSAHESAKAAVSLATTVLEDPTGYGRIVRGDGGQLEAIVEDRDCTDEQRNICEVNPSYYCFGGRDLFNSLKQVNPNNAKGEYYITDAVHILVNAGRKATAPVNVPPEDAMGINSRADLAVVGGLMEGRIQRMHQDAGVTIVSPHQTWIQSGASIGVETVIEPFSYVGVDCSIGRSCRIGPCAVMPAGATLEDGEHWTRERNAAGPEMSASLGGRSG
jgi:bifunctional UDP-N-acetylglucosamine pyrophosphorylase/glucosamine-1-phosphate N-acetyltransferase